MFRLIILLTTLGGCASLTSVETKMALCKNICQDRVHKYEAVTGDCYCYSPEAKQ